MKRREERGENRKKNVIGNRKESRLVEPAPQVVGGDGWVNIFSKFTGKVARRGIIADSEFVEIGRRAISELHLAPAVKRHAADLGSSLPQKCRQMTNLMEDVIGNIVLAKMWHHGLQLALVPAFGNASSDVERVAGDSEEVLSLVDVTEKVGVREDAHFRRSPGTSFTLGIPDKWCGIVVGTRSVMMV